MTLTLPQLTRHRHLVSSLVHRIDLPCLRAYTRDTVRWIGTLAIGAIGLGLVYLLGVFAVWFSF